ncbi:MAG: hypothetical protein M0D57_16295 [Sphingobacteriales bacterium JAD_PAG50586_3]|nr:MAG: hypothetical protein M0D57_16295 [Sphingobacteriales bacterium JAD_PAG50586_3]
MMCSPAATLNVSVDVFQSYKQLPPAWDVMLPAGHKLKTTSLASIEDSNIEHVNYYYGVLTLNGAMVGAMYLQRLDVNNNHYPNFSSNGAIARQVYNTIAKRSYGLLVAGNLFYTGFPSYWFNNQAISVDVFYKAFKQAINKLLSATKSSAVMLKDVDASLKEQLETKNWGYAHMGEDIFMQMPLRAEWKTFADYTQSLSKKYAARVKKMLEARLQLTVKELNLAEIEAYLPDIERLYLDVCSHSSVKMGVLNGAYFLNMKKSMGEKFEVWGWFKDGQMLAFTTAVIENGDYEVYYIGYSDADNKSYCIYPNILLHGVERSIYLQKKTLKLGRTALEAKAIIGCKPLYLDNYIKLKSKPMQLGFKYMLKVFVTERGTDWKKRNPFKA